MKKKNYKMMKACRKEEITFNSGDLIKAMRWLACKSDFIMFVDFKDTETYSRSEVESVIGLVLSKSIRHKNYGQLYRVLIDEQTHELWWDEMGKVNNE